MPHKDPEQKRAYQRAWYERKKKDLVYWADLQQRNRESARRFKGVVDATGERRVGNCEICGDHSDPLYLDHDHTTGLSRGWLCNRCNRGLGAFRDNPDWLRKAAEYVENNQSSET